MSHRRTVHAVALICATAPAGAAGGTPAASAWSALEAERYGRCAARFAHAAHRALSQGDRDEAAGHAYWTARCLAAHREGHAAAARWMGWIATEAPRSWHAALIRSSAGGRPRSERRLLVRSVIRTESAGRPRAVSPKGAVGLMQVMPHTAAEVIRRLGGSADHTLACLLDRSCNRAVGSRYLEEQIAAFGGNLILALAAYNAGPARAARWWRTRASDDPVELVDRIPIGETRRYVRSVLAWMWHEGGREAPGSASPSLAQIRAGRWPTLSPRPDRPARPRIGAHPGETSTASAPATTAPPPAPPRAPGPRSGAKRAQGRRARGRCRRRRRAPRAPPHGSAAGPHRRPPPDRRTSSAG